MDDQELRREAARVMGRAKSPKKERAVQANGERGGRPKESKDSYQRTRAKKGDKGVHYEPATDD